MRTLSLSKRQRRFVAISVCLVLLFAGGYAVRRPLLASPAVYLRIEDPLRPADLIAVMPSDWQGVDYGIELYKMGYAPKLMLIGGYPFKLIAQDGESLRVVKMDWEQVARGIALQAGVPDDAILTRGGSSTYEQARQQHPPMHVLGLTLHQLGKHLAGAGKLTALHTLSGGF